MRKFVRETARQLKTDTGTICRWRWRDRFRSTCEVKDRPCVGRPMVTSETSGNVYGILKLQLFWCDPESIKCPELCYFTPVFGKQGTKLKLKLQCIWPNIQNYFCVFCFWTIEFVSWWGETFLSKFITTQAETDKQNRAKQIIVFSIIMSNNLYQVT